MQTIDNAVNDILTGYSFFMGITILTLLVAGAIWLYVCKDSDDC